jgi:hypothetical protein
LPKSITQSGANDVTAPEGSLPNVAGENGEVTSPEDATTPQVGATPSDGPLDVVMPESLTPDVPTVGQGINPIEAVIPPVGWIPEQDINITSYAVDDGGSGGYNRQPVDNDSESEKDQKSQREATGSTYDFYGEREVAKWENFWSTGKSNTANSRKAAEVMMVAGNPSNSIPYPKSPEWVAALKAVGEALAETAKVIGPGAARVIGGVAAAVIIGTQAGSGEMPDYLLHEEDTEGQETPDYDAHPPIEDDKAPSVDDLSDDEIIELAEKIGGQSRDNHKDQAEANGLGKDDLVKIAKEILTGQRVERLDDVPWDDGSVGFHEPEFGYGLLANPNHADDGTMFIPDTEPGENSKDAFDKWLDRISND